ncbi:Hypothetical predicted protein [Mytilus galloprovincialis]|uniref:C17orf113 probable zinc finger domain-containing protein n=1 Tax=Mytilus galloprovincialis TaxID=29158 RepID=A0A8B6GLW1_MYTGA|nr:Hypothetical predicted protein [Mytilus galloprovincialis]
MAAPTFQQSTTTRHDCGQIIEKSNIYYNDDESQSEAAPTQNSTPEDTDKHDNHKNNEVEIENSPLIKTNSTSPCTVSTTSTTNFETQRIEIDIEKQRKLLEETFKDNTKKIHHFSICKDRCESLSFEDPQSTSKNKHRFKHSTLMDKNTSFSQDTGLWWLVYIEQEGMYCLLCKNHHNLNPKNKDIFCMKPGLRFRKEAIQDHSKSKVHKAAELEENIQRVSPFQKEVNNRKEYASEVLLIAFTSLYWLAKEEVANSKFKSLINLLEVVGVSHMKHFNHSSAGSIREMFLSIGDVITEDLVQKVNMADSFGLMIDEVTDISLIEQLVCFIQYVDRAGCPTIHFHFTADLLKESDSADAATIVKVIKEKLLNLGIDISKLRSLATDGASVMTGKKNGVAALLRKEHPGIINIHCICHKLALACADTKTELKDIDLVQLTLIQLWKYFQNSPKRTAVYLKLQEGTKYLKLNESSRKMVAKRLKKACTTRWLSFDLSVQAVFDDYAAVLQTLSQLSEKDTAAYGLLKRMKKTRFLGTLYILKCILPPLSKLSKIFQTGNIDFSSIGPSIQYTIDTMEEISKSKQPLEEMKKDLQDGKLTMVTKEFKVSDTDFKQLETLLTKYVTALKENINSRFEDALSVLKAFDIFNPVSLPERTDTEFRNYGVTSLDSLMESFYPNIEQDEKNEIVTEWNKIKYNMLEWKKMIIDNNNSSDLSKTQMMLKMIKSVERGVIIGVKKTDLATCDVKVATHLKQKLKICYAGLFHSSAGPSICMLVREVAVCLI